MIKIIQKEEKKVIELDSVDWSRAKVLAYCNGKLMGMLFKDNLLPESHGNYGRYIFVCSNNGGGCSGYHDTPRKACEHSMKVLPHYELFLVD